MSVTYEKNRKNPWRTRFYFNGEEIHVGYYKTKKEAVKALEDYEKGLKRLEKTTLESYEIHSFEPQDSGIAWLKPFRKLRLKRTRKA